MNHINGILLGVGLGMLVGLLTGLSATPVVAAVIGTLLSIFGAVCGLSSMGSTLGPGTAEERSLRVVAVAGFGFAATFAVLGGVYLRTNNVLSPSPSERVAAWTEAEYPPETARLLAAFEISGVVPETVKVDNSRASAISTLLYSGNRPLCDRLDPNELTDAESWRVAASQIGDSWANLAAVLAPMTEDEQVSVFRVTRSLLCED